MMIRLPAEVDWVFMLNYKNVEKAVCYGSKYGTSNHWL